MSKEDLPRWMEEFWSDNPTEYTKEDLQHLEPNSENVAFLKYLVINGFAKLILRLNGKNKGEFNGSDDTIVDFDLGSLTIQKNSKDVGVYDGSTSKTINLTLGTLKIQKNGADVGTYNGDGNVTANISVPVVTYGTGAPSGGKTGDVYMRYS